MSWRLGLLFHEKEHSRDHECIAESMRWTTPRTSKHMCFGQSDQTKQRKRFFISPALASYDQGTSQKNAKPWFCIWTVVQKYLPLSKDEVRQPGTPRQRLSPCLAPRGGNATADLKERDLRQRASVWETQKITRPVPEEERVCESKTISFGDCFEKREALISSGADTVGSEPLKENIYS